MFAQTHDREQQLAARLEKRGIPLRLEPLLRVTARQHSHGNLHHHLEHQLQLRALDAVRALSDHYASATPLSPTAAQEPQQFHHHGALALVLRQRRHYASARARGPTALRHHLLHVRREELALLLQRP